LHELAELRSLAIHEAIARQLGARPELLERARQRVAEWLQTGSVAPAYAREWQRILSAPVDDIARLLTDPDQTARALRQVSPFAGAIGARERWTIWRQVRDAYGA
jgi:hypothetical protein